MIKVQAAKLCEQPLLEDNKLILSTVEETTNLMSPLTEKADFLVMSQSSQKFRDHFFPGIPDNKWNNWRWQIQHSFTSVDQLLKIFETTINVKDEHIKKSRKLPLRITPYYAAVMYDRTTDNSILKSVIPTKYELILSPGEESDPLHEENMSPVPNLVHRYPDRVLLLSTGFCSVYCRYCTRSHMVLKDKKHYGKNAWERSIQYINHHEEIRDVVISGGDPLTMPDTHLEYLVSSLRSIPHIEIIRIGTKVPMVLPQRITKKLVNMLKKYHPLYLSIHATHPDEFTPEASEALNRLANAGIVMGSQTVLLKGINDNPEIMKKLMHQLLINRVRPYYLYQCDPIPGSAHFRTPVETGLEIIRNLRGYTSGYAVPHYVIDAPGGGGKIPLLPEYYQGRDGDYVILKNFEGKIFKYKDTTNADF